MICYYFFGGVRLRRQPDPLTHRKIGHVTEKNSKFSSLPRCLSEVEGNEASKKKNHFNFPFKTSNSFFKEAFL